MPLNDPYGFNAAGETFLEVEVSDSMLDKFERKYLSVTGITVSPGDPAEFQRQPNKWGTECRIYFNSPRVADDASALGLHVEGPRTYRNNFQYRINNYELWWELVEDYGFRLGKNT